MKTITTWLLITGLMAACILPSYFMQNKSTQPEIENSKLPPTMGSQPSPPTPGFTPSTPIQETIQPFPTQEDLIQTLISLSFDRYLVDYTINQIPIRDSQWVGYHYDSVDMQCIRGGETFVMVRKGTQADKTVFWLAGGGSCYPGRDDCIKEAKFLNSIEHNNLASTDNTNPFRDWNFIYVPYCDGSIHLGDHDADYDNDGVIDHRHQGLKMTSAPVTLMGELFPESQKILIAGCSAGGAGTIGVPPLVRLQFPQASLYVLNASGPALANPAMRDTLDLIFLTWNMRQFTPISCLKCTDQLIFFYGWLLERDPLLKIGFFSSYHDPAYYSGWNMSPELAEWLLLDVTGEIHNNFPDTFKRYFIRQEMHCVQDYTYTVQGVTIWNWLNALVNDDPGWRDIME